MACAATPSRWCVCQFHHFRKSLSLFNAYLFKAWTEVESDWAVEQVRLGSALEALEPFLPKLAKIASPEESHPA